MQRLDPHKMVAAAGLGDALVLTGRVGTRRSMAALDLTRNGVEHDGPVLYGLDIGPDESCRAHAAYADRVLYRYRWDIGTSRGVLTPVSCVRSDR